VFFLLFLIKKIRDFALPVFAFSAGELAFSGSRIWNKIIYIYKNITIDFDFY